MQRLIAPAILIPLLLWYIHSLDALWFTGLLAVLSVVAQMEFYSMYRVRGAFPVIASLLGAGWLLVLSGGGGSIDLLIFAVMLLCVLRLFSRKGTSEALHDLAPLFTGLIYIPLLLSAVVALRLLDPEWVIFLLGAIWSADGLAYFSGKYLGKRKLFPSVSPKKTWLGAGGSLVGGALGALLARLLFSMEVTFEHTLLAGAAIGVVSIFGDLVESMFKRDAGVKDSGGVIPGGHGGILDKLDSALFSAPVLYWLLLRWGYTQSALEKLLK